MGLGQRLQSLYGRLRYGRHLAFFMQKNKGAEYQRFLPWFKANGDETLRLNYDLNSHSVVFDLGGYHGDWAYEISKRYHSKIFIFEPVAHFAAKIRQRFQNQSSIQVFEYGLSNQDSQGTLNLSQDASSAFQSGGNAVPVQFKKADEFLKQHGIAQIDLIKINIEGGEYDLLEHLIASGWISKIVNLQIQFHDFVPNARERMARIQAGLQKTHHTTYQFEFVWENWRLNKKPL